MKAELQYLFLTAMLTGILWIPVVIGYVSARGTLRPVDYRTAPTSPLPDWVNRANRAHLNAVESLTPFAVVVIIAQILGISTSVTVTAAMVFFWARLAHAILHLSGIGILMARTVAFTTGWLAFMTFAWELYRHSA